MRAVRQPSGGVTSTDEILAGLGLVIVLAIACQLVAARVGLPAIVLLLPAGFLAGAATDYVHPDALFGDTFQPIVSLGVGLILFEAGLRLRLHELRGGIRGVVVRLILIGTLVTAVGVMLAVRLIFGVGWGVAVVLGAILVVSGPTVVLPLLAFVRPTDRVRSVLKWEGVLIDPIGALLGVIAFHAVQASAGGDRVFDLVELPLSLVTGLIVGVIGVGILWLLLRSFQRAAPRQAVSAALMVVAGVLVVADILREDSGFVATTVMGMIMANRRKLDASRILEFHGTVVNLLIGVLFILISASVEPSQVGALLPGGLVLIAVMALVIRPLVVALGTWGSTLDRAERTFMGWLAPRGIVAAATASAFGLQLTQAGVAGADQVLPIAFIAMFGTVLLYGLTAAPSPASSGSREPARGWCSSSEDTRGLVRSPTRSSGQDWACACGRDGPPSRWRRTRRGWPRATPDSRPTRQAAKPSSRRSTTSCS
ncbi:MAG: sodium:proton exchanger [Solirubrobacterales bacterium]|nr:sodium:proton exchanger [Solirubrobacterales bacterium]